MSGQVQLAGQRRVEVDSESRVRPVVEKRFRIEQAADLGPRPGMGELVPPLGRHDLAVSVGGLVPGEADVARGRYQ